MRVSVIVPTWQRAQWLRRCLEGIRAQERRADEIIVVGRDSDGAARVVVAEEAEQTPGVRWASVEVAGHIPPVRCGLKEATGEIVVFLDDDAQPFEGWLQSLLRPFQDPMVACVGGRVEPAHVFSGKVHPDAGQIRWYGKHVGNIGMRNGRNTVNVAGVMECNWAWRTYVLRNLKFDPVFVTDDASMYGLDLCLQARAKGHRVVYQPQARVIHHVAPRDGFLDREDRPRRTVAYSRNYTYIGLRHLRGIRRAMFVIWWWLVGERGSYGVLTGLYDLIAQGPRRIAPLMLASFKGKWEGARTWSRNPTR